MKPHLVVALLLFVNSGVVAGQEKPTTRKWEIAGIPALNYDADEGFGYGAIIEIYNHGNGSSKPYAFTLQPNVFLTTGGRRDASLFFDAPDLLPGAWRITANIAREQQLATPYYGLGNDTEYDERLESAPNDYYYRFGRTRRVLSADLQHPIGNSPVRFLVGTSVSTVTLDPSPFDSGTTLLQSDMAANPSPLHGWYNALRGGLVWDSRDREIGTRRGAWTEVLVQRYDKVLGSERSYTRWTVTDRRYWPVSPRLTFAQRLLLQGVEGNVPVHDISTIQTSFKNQEGLGGAKSVRGLPRNRYQGKGLLLGNAELRWRAAEFRALRSPAYVVLSGFADAGRVWADDIVITEALTDLRLGYGGGVRLGLGSSFVVAVDVGHSSQSTAPVYIGLGYLF
jgi:hypothetical protein